MTHLPRCCSRLASNKPHAGGCSARGNNRSSWLPQAIVRIIKTHESEMAACNKSFTSSCFVHFLNNRTFPPSLPLPPVPLCLGPLSAKCIRLSSRLTQVEGGRQTRNGWITGANLCAIVSCFCLSSLKTAFLERGPQVPLCPVKHSPFPLLALPLTLSWGYAYLRSPALYAKASPQTLWLITRLLPCTKDTAHIIDTPVQVPENLPWSLPGAMVVLTSFCCSVAQSCLTL